MKRLLPAVLLLAASYTAFAYDLPSGPPAKIDFSWRKHAGEFPKDKPGYLILTTEDAVRWSKVLPQFVKQKEAMGFRVYLATEKDYGTGKKGNEQAAQVRAWMREFNKRAGLQYALLIGNSGPGSTDLPSPTIPDGERCGMEESYADIDGAWVDLYLNTKEKDTRSHWTQMLTGSLLKSKYLKEGGGRKDDLIMSRISYVGNEVGTGAYDLDRILDKTIRYERDTVAGKNLDWRADAYSVISNYGGNNWDDPFIKAAEKAGGSFEWHSALGISGPYVPENTFDGDAVNYGLMNQVRRRGLLSTMSHGWNRGGEGITDHWSIFKNIDDRWPSTVGVAACTAFALADNGNMGQTWLRKGGVFACGTAMSANNGYRRQMQVNLLEKRVTTGESVRNGVVTYGDPSLRVLPPEGAPARALLLAPAFTARYEERTLTPGAAFKTVAEIYTLTNQSKDDMRVTVECDAAWVTLSSAKLTLKPGETAKVEAVSNDRAQKLAPGTHVSNIRFLRDDGQRDERRLAFNLAPVTLACAYTFDEATQGTRFPDLVIPAGFGRDLNSLWLVDKKDNHHQKRVIPGKTPVVGFAPLAQGRVGGALRLDTPAAPFTRGLPGFTQWRGNSASLWFKVDAIPTKPVTILAAPFSLILNAKGGLVFSQGGKPAALGVITPGAWHFILLRSDVADGKVRASLDGKPEVVAVAPKPPADALTLGSFAGAVDEVKVWSGELSNAAASRELAGAGKPFVLPVEAPAATYADDGVLRAPKEMPRAFDITETTKTLDLSKFLADAGLAGAGLREAPEWLEFKNGALALKSGVDFNRIDFGGYDFFLVLKSKDGRVCEHPVKARIPVPAVSIRIVRAADNTLSIVSAGDRYGDPKRPLAKGVIRYTTDGSPVTEKSPVYDKPFKTEGDKVIARFFYLGEYPYAPVTMNSEFGIPRDTWKPLAVTGKGKAPGSLKNAETAFDGRTDTVWKNSGATLPQFYAWDMGRSETLSAISVHSTIKDAIGRINGYNLLASDDGKTWKSVKTGELESTPGAVRIAFGTPLSTRYLKLEATTLHDGKDMVITEIEAYAK
jgi:hypothetical protein